MAGPEGARDPASPSLSFAVVPSTERALCTGVTGRRPSRVHVPMRPPPEVVHCGPAPSVARPRKPIHRVLSLRPAKAAPQVAGRGYSSDAGRERVNVGEVAWRRE